MDRRLRSVFRIEFHRNDEASEWNEKPSSLYCSTIGFHHVSLVLLQYPRVRRPGFGTFHLESHKQTIARVRRLEARLF